MLEVRRLFPFNQYVLVFLIDVQLVGRSLADVHGWVRNLAFSESQIGNKPLVLVANESDKHLVRSLVSKDQVEVACGVELREGHKLAPA